MELKGLKINILGDSITEGCGASSFDRGFASLLQSEYGAVVRNYGIGGARIAMQYHLLDWEPPYDRNYVIRAKEMDKDADVVIVFGGTNDFGHGDAPFGSFADRRNATFYGACHELFSYLESTYAGKEIVVMTPMHRADEDITADKFTTHPLIDYVRAIREVAEYYSLPVFDTWANIGLTPKVPEIMKKFICDGLHPSDLGHALLAKKLAAYLRTL